MQNNAGVNWKLGFQRGDLTFHYFLIRRPGPRLAVFYSALRPVGDTRPDYFNRIRWAADLDCSCLYVADPGLQLRPTVRGTWFQGTPEYFSAERIAEDITRISAEFGFKERETLMAGSSQGGFGALAVAAFMPKTRVVVEMPQTNVLAYESQVEVHRMARVCYFAKNATLIPPRYKERYDLATLFAARKHVPRGLVLVKDSDTHHLVEHAEPMLKAVANDRLSLEVITGDPGGPGHTPLPKEMVIERIADMFAA
jgi:hypothetical protein